jgi:hypothetical protein
LAQRKTPASRSQRGRNNRQQMRRLNLFNRFPFRWQRPDSPLDDQQNLGFNVINKTIGHPCERVRPFFTATQRTLFDCFFYE